MGRHEQVACVLAFFPVSEFCVEACREELDVPEFWLQGPQDQQLVIHVRSDHADGFDRFPVLAQIANSTFQAPQVVLLRGSHRTVKVGSRAFLLTGWPLPSPALQKLFLLSITGNAPI